MLSNSFLRRLQWQKKTSREFTGSGFVVKTKYGPKLLTNAHVVASSTTVRIRRSGSSQMFRAKVKAIGYECDLAELEVDDPAFWDEPDVLGQVPLTLDQLIDSDSAPEIPDMPHIIPHDDQPTKPATTATPTAEMMYPDPMYKYGLELGGLLPELHSHVTVAGYPTGGDNISVTRGVVSRIEPQPYGTLCGSASTVAALHNSS